MRGDKKQGGMGRGKGTFNGTKPASLSARHQIPVFLQSCRTRLDGVQLLLFASPSSRPRRCMDDDGVCVAGSACVADLTFHGSHSPIPSHARHTSFHSRLTAACWISSGLRYLGLAWAGPGGDRETGGPGLGVMGWDS